MRELAPKSNNRDSIAVRASRIHPNASGYTLIDLLVVISGVVPALWVSSYFHTSWPILTLNFFTFVFGISFWCFLFLWLLPLLRRRKSNQASPNDNIRNA